MGKVDPGNEPASAVSAVIVLLSLQQDQDVHNMLWRSVERRKSSSRSSPLG